MVFILKYFQYNSCFYLLELQNKQNSEPVRSSGYFYGGQNDMGLGQMPLNNYIINLKVNKYCCLELGFIGSR